MVVDNFRIDGGIRHIKQSKFYGKDFDYETMLFEIFAVDYDNHYVDCGVFVDGGDKVLAYGIYSYDDGKKQSEFNLANFVSAEVKQKPYCPYPNIIELLDKLMELGVDKELMANVTAKQLSCAGKAC